ncbi:structural maintenance of chromosomes protein 2-1-like isoform X2 [Gossypium australe]|uniref:Structural maintenance of chromosomes protein 2-1-like isoform X2 n=1 Tax=Gossypium australe TaxID=47621 RepID=A0A5B6VN81_9ROSI|nr:structural maintenance of chromosomes protein 2-1-like isoform X2 [Gossypium australe]
MELLATFVGKDNAKLALSLVGYDEELESAMEYVFGASFVCKTTDAAKEACPSDCFHMWFFKQCETIHYSLIWLQLLSKFHLYLSPKNNINCQFMYGFFSFQLNVLQVAFNREIHTPSVTLESDIFQPSGLLTGGSCRYMKIKNPNYKGKWTAPMIDNPGLPSLVGLGLENPSDSLWVKGGDIFCNTLIPDPIVGSRYQDVAFITGATAFKFNSSF